MFIASPHPLLVPADGTFTIADAATTPSDVGMRSSGDRSEPVAEPRKSDWKRKLEAEKDALRDWQHKLYADDRYAMLLIFQALDAGGKDGTIRHVLSSMNPTGLHVASFKRPSPLELGHDFLWRTTRELPARGHVAVFNRSYYEEVLVVRVHPDLLAAQRLPEPFSPSLWQERYESIVAHEHHLARQGTVILKFWLNISRDEQRRRFAERIEKPHKRWKFSTADLDESEHWDAYRAAYEECLNATSRPWAPWYAVPADDKPYMRWQVATLINAAFEQLGVDFPQPSEAALAELERARRRL